MAGGRRTAWRRLAGSAALALLLMAGCSALPAEPPRQPPEPAGPTPVATATPPVPAPVSLPPAPAGKPQPVLGVIGDQPTVLAGLDPGSLRPLPGRRLELDGAVAGYGWSPDRKTLVLGDNDEAALYVIDADRLRLLRTVPLGSSGAPTWFGWLGPRRLVVAGGPDGGHRTTLELVDPVAGRKLARWGVDGVPWEVARAGPRVVLLLTPSGGIGPARLAVLDGPGVVRTVTLPGVTAGLEPPRGEGPDATARQRGAGLAVDGAGGRAFVAAAGAALAEVDLRSLRVTHHALGQPTSGLRRWARWLLPPAEAKLLTGPVRQACWLGDGLVAVWGSEHRLVKNASGQLQRDEAPTGLQLLDTQRRALWPLHPRATMATYRQGRLLAYGGSWSAAEQRTLGTGLTVYGPGSRRPVRLLGSRLVGDVQVNGHLAYAGVLEDGSAGHTAVVDLRTVRVLRTSPGPLPYLLLSDGDDQGC